MLYKINFVKYSKKPYFITDETGKTVYEVTKTLFGNYKFLLNSEVQYLINKGMVSNIYQIFTSDRKQFSSIRKINLEGPDNYEFRSKEDIFVIKEPEKNSFTMVINNTEIATAVYDKYNTKDFTVDVLDDTYTERIILFFVARHIDD